MRFPEQRPPWPRRRTRPVTAAVLAALLLAAAACGGDEGDGGSSEEGSATGAELQMYAWSSSPAEDEVLRTAVEDYNAEGRNTVELNILPEYDTALQTALASGEPPDVFYLNDNRLPDMVEAGALAPVGDQIEDADDFYPSLREAFTYDGTFYCPPKDFSTLQLVYNTQMFEEAGVEAPTTWDELAAAAEALTQPDRPGLVLNGEFFRWGPFAVQAGGWLTSEDGTQATVDSPEMNEAMQFVAGLHADGFAASADAVGAGWGGEALGQGRAAMTIEGNWIVGAMETDFPDVEYAVAELPEGPAGKGTMTFTVCYGVSAASENQEAAVDFVNFLVSPERQLVITEQFPVMPSRQSIADQWLESKPELEAFVLGAEYAQDSIFAPGFTPTIDELNSGIQGLASGDREVADVLSAAQGAAEEVLGS